MNAKSLSFDHYAEEDHRDFKKRKTSSMVTSSRLGRNSLIQQFTSMYGMTYTELWTRSWNGLHLLHDSESCVIGSYVTGEDLIELKHFHQVSRRFTFTKGEGIVGRAWNSKAPEVERNVQIVSDQSCPRKQAALKASLKGVIAVPVYSTRQQLLGVLASYQYNPLGNNVSGIVAGIQAVAQEISPGLEFEGVSSNMQVMEYDDENVQEQDTSTYVANTEQQNSQLPVVDTPSAAVRLGMANALLSMLPHDKPDESQKKVIEAPPGIIVDPQATLAREQNGNLFTEYTPRSTSKGVILQSSSTCERATWQMEEADMVLAMAAGQRT